MVYPSSVSRVSELSPIRAPECSGRRDVGAYQGPDREEATSGRGNGGTGFRYSQRLLTVMDKHWRVELFGGVRLVGADRTVRRFPAPKGAALLAFLPPPPHRAKPP